MDMVMAIGIIPRVIITRNKEHAPLFAFRGAGHVTGVAGLDLIGAGAHSGRAGTVAHYKGSGGRSEHGPEEGASTAPELRAVNPLIGRPSRQRTSALAMRCAGAAGCAN